jgi:uncharacterized protein (DUF2147 family)
MANREDNMRTAVRAMALWAGGLLLAAGAAMADPVEGTWQTAPDDNGNIGHVRIEPCAAAFCGTLVAAFDSSLARVDSPNIGRQIVWDMVPDGDGAYAGGRIWAPDRDRTYVGKMRLDGTDRLTVSGCVLGGAICRDGGTWRRVP